MATQPPIDQPTRFTFSKPALRKEVIDILSFLRNGIGGVRGPRRAAIPQQVNRVDVKACLF